MSYASGTNRNLAGGDVTVIEGELRIASGGSITAAGTQASNVAEVAITYSSNDPSITPNGAVTVADGSAATVAELLELIVELKANQDAMIQAMEGAGILAS